MDEQQIIYIQQVYQVLFHFLIMVLLVHRPCLGKMRKIDGCDMEKFGTLDSSEKTIVILGDRWWPRTTKQEGDTMSKNQIYVIYGKNVMSAQMLEVSL